MCNTKVQSDKQGEKINERSQKIIRGSIWVQVADRYISTNKDNRKQVN